MAQDAGQGFHIHARRQSVSGEGVPLCETGVSILDKVLQKLVKQIRNEDLRRDKTTFGIVDAQSVQNADTAEEKGYDAGKKYQESNVTL